MQLKMQEVCPDITEIVVKSLRFKRLISTVGNIKADRAGWLSLNFISYFNAIKERVDIAISKSVRKHHFLSFTWNFTKKVT